MPVPIQEVGCNGRLNLVFACQGGKTVIAENYSEAPHKVTRLYHSRGSNLARLILMNMTPGLFGGDQVETSLYVKSGARILVSTQSSIKLHPGLSGSATQIIRLQVESGGELHYYSDPLIPFAGARLSSELHIEVDPGARFYMWDGFMAGRIARGERWRFDRIRNQAALKVGTELAYLEHVDLDPKSRAYAPSWRMDACHYVGTGIFYDARLGADFCERLHAAIAGPGFGVDSPASGVIIIKLVSASGPAFHAIRARTLALLFENVVGEPIPKAFLV